MPAFKKRWRGKLLQPTPLTEVPHRHYRTGRHQHDGKGVAPSLAEFRHVLKVHAVDAGNQRRWQQSHARHREDLDDLVLVDVDETDRGVHQEVDLVEQEGGVRVERIDVAQDLARLLERKQDAAIDGPLSSVMTRNPRCVRSGAPASEAIEILANRKLSELPVVDAQLQPIGLIDITDLAGWLPRTESS